MSVTIDSVLVQGEELSEADLAGDVVVMSPRAGFYFGFNPVASEIWHMLAEPRRVGQIFDMLLQRHDVGPEALMRDVTPFLETLIEERLVRRVEPSDAR